jgi:hypothetical protein
LLDANADLADVNDAVRFIRDLHLIYTSQARALPMPLRTVLAGNERRIGVILRLRSLGRPPRFTRERASLRVTK